MFNPVKKYTTDVIEGKKGDTSAAAKYAAATPRDGFSVQDDKPYAEVRS